MILNNTDFISSNFIKLVLDSKKQFYIHDIAMRFVAVFLSVYILLLSCMPCGDVKDCKELNGNRTEYSTSAHSGHENDIETCSPFCSCLCCGQTANFGIYTAEIKCTIYSTTPKFFFPSASFQSEFHSSIWQPPKLG